LPSVAMLSSVQTECCQHAHRMSGAGTVYNPCPLRNQIATPVSRFAECEQQMATPSFHFG
jgi:hypothetical protein